MPSLSVVKEFNATYKPDYVPVVVVTGGTSGIGQGVVEAFARYLSGRVRIVIVGRSEAAANAIIASLPTPPAEQASTDITPGYEFLPCDLTLMKNAHQLAATLRDKLPRINYLVHSAGVIGLRGRLETDEGIDVKMATRYYARWVLTHDLLPLLRNAKACSQPAGVLSVLGVGVGPANITIDDLGLKTTYSGMKCMTESAAYNDLMIEEFATREPGIAFTHVEPGSVDTPIAVPHNFILKILAAIIMRPVAWLVAMSKETCAEYLLYGMLSVGNNGGMYRRNSSADDVGKHKFPGPEGAGIKLWDHTVEITGSK